MDLCILSNCLRDVIHTAMHARLYGFMWTLEMFAGRCPYCDPHSLSLSSLSLSLCSAKYQKSMLFSRYYNMKETLLSDAILPALGRSCLTSSDSWPLKVYWLISQCGLLMRYLKIIFINFPLRSDLGSWRRQSSAQKCWWKVEKRRKWCNCILISKKLKT